MSPAAALVLLITVLITSFISGIFGMAGGLILMAVLTAVVPVATAMVVHGAVQMVSNGYRAILWRKYIDWAIFRRYALGSVAAILLLFAISWRPDATAVYLLLAAAAFTVWIPKNWIDIDVQRWGQAETAGFLLQAMNTLAGVTGPLLDIFFARSVMDRRAVVATKAITLVFAHLVKVVFWGAALWAAETVNALPPLWFFAAAVPLSMLGTTLGGKLLERMTDIDFRRWMRLLVTAVGLFMLTRAAGWL
ncbi:MAG: hypothetical protein B7Z22_08280 [Hyphomonas sp. 32-62-5]|nr:MAG: hypothetical protein B7Z22_08280 [Hyphomonas sp. 32-62-5]